MNIRKKYLETLNFEETKIIISGRLYSKFVQEVIEEINFARTKPSEYAAKLERISSTLNGRKVKVGKSIMKLKEGSAIFDETIQYLLNIGQMEPLELCDGLSESANELLSILIISDCNILNKLSFSSKLSGIDICFIVFGIFL